MERGAERVREAAEEALVDVLKSTCTALQVPPVCVVTFHSVIQASPSAHDVAFHPAFNIAVALRGST
jgi:hypothetical protein